MLQPASKPSRIIDRQKWSKTETLRVYIGDKVIYTVNCYGLSIFNGEVGIVKEFDDADGIVVDFGDRVATIPTIIAVEGRNGTFYPNPQKDLELAYAITTHKAQGSEYERVCYVVNGSRPFALNRKNFYTGTMRAKRFVQVIADQRGLSMSLYKKE